MGCWAEEEAAKALTQSLRAEPRAGGESIGAGVLPEAQDSGHAAVTILATLMRQMAQEIATEVVTEPARVREQQKPVGERRTHATFDGGAGRAGRCAW